MDIRYLGASKRYSEAVVANGLVFSPAWFPKILKPMPKRKLKMFWRKSIHGSHNANPTKPIF